jgi:hypothetical protein
LNELLVLEASGVLNEAFHQSNPAEEKEEADPRELHGNTQMVRSIAMLRIAEYCIEVVHSPVVAVALGSRLVKLLVH